MSDIVERLRLREPPIPLMREAAAEVERLELEVAAWKQASDLKAAEIKRLKAEIEQLKADQREMAVLLS
jgi:hypothetical protein